MTSEMESARDDVTGDRPPMLEYQAAGARGRGRDWVRTVGEGFFAASFGAMTLGVVLLAVKKWGREPYTAGVLLALVPITLFRTYASLDYLIRGK